jgi:hypothetical protein
MKLQIIQLEPYDDVISIRDRLSFVSTERVLLVWPKRANARPLRRKLDLVLIQREAERRQTHLALVTSDATVIEYADELNISVFRSVHAGQRGGAWRQPRNKVFIDRADQPEDSPDPFELKLIASRLRELTPAERRQRQVSRILVILLLIATAVGTAYVVGPGAEIVIHPAQSQIETTAQIIADPRVTFVDVEQGIIPAVITTLEVEVSASIPTTGTLDVPNSPATGKVVFTNQTNDEIIVPIGTVVYSTGRNPARFQTKEDAIITAGVGNVATVNIEAIGDAIGTRGNVEPNLIIFIEGPLNDVLAVRNPDFTRGGTVRPQGVVTAEDYNNLLPLTNEKLIQTARTNFSAGLAGSQVIVPNSVQIVPGTTAQTTYSAFVGDRVETLSLTMRATMQALIIDQQPAQAAARARLARLIPEGQSLVLESLSYELGLVRPPDASGKAALVMTVAGNISARIDTDTARDRLVGVSTQDALDMLDRDWLLDPLRPPEITVWPSFFGRLPLLAARINVIIKE